MELQRIADEITSLIHKYFFFKLTDKCVTEEISNI